MDRNKAPMNDDGRAEVIRSDNAIIELDTMELEWDQAPDRSAHTRMAGDDPAIADISVDTDDLATTDPMAAHPKPLTEQQAALANTERGGGATAVDSTGGVEVSGPQENPTASFDFVVPNFLDVEEKRMLCDWYEHGGFRWRILLFPKGNNTLTFISVYLECGGPVSTSAQAVPDVRADAPLSFVSSDRSPGPWSRAARFKLMFVNLADEAALSQTPNADEEMVGTASSSAHEQRDMARSRRPTISQEAQYRFSHKGSDWGFLEFADRNVVEDPTSGFVVNGYAKLRVEVTLIDESALENSFSSGHWDSRKETGFVGLKNQGATCYMNSLLQTLYSVGAFRKSVYSMPLPESSGANGALNGDGGRARGGNVGVGVGGGSSASEEMSYALQKVFYELQYSPSVVKTKKLTESFGWDTSDAFTQHDVQELNRILCDHLEEKMKKQNPNERNTISQLFEGKLLNYIECVHVPYKSTREESFYDLSLNVKGCRNISESFEKYTEVEMMEDDNKYRADGYEELQEARKGVKFLKVPPVLQLHLKRFEYDFMRDVMVKINDRFEFQPEIDLSQFVENSDGSDVYVLHSVLVHIGDVHAGHYYVYIRPDLSADSRDSQAQWYKFDDEVVSKVKEEEAIEDNFGSGFERKTPPRTLHDGDEYGSSPNIQNGGQTPPSAYQPRSRVQARRLSNAYMLQYIRRDKVAELLSDASENDVPKELSARIRQDHDDEERRKKERAEQHLYIHVCIAEIEDMRNYHGPDLLDWDQLEKHRLKRTLLLGDLKRMISTSRRWRGTQQLRVWRCRRRENGTIRPDTLLAGGLDDAPISDTRLDGSRIQDPMKLFVELVQDQEIRQRVKELQKLRPMDELSRSQILLPSDSQILVFVKQYHPVPIPRVDMLWCGLFDRSSRVEDLVPLVRKISMLGDDEELLLFEEIGLDSVSKLPLEHTLFDLRMVHGGHIVVFQRVDARLQEAHALQVKKRALNSLETSAGAAETQGRAPRPTARGGFGMDADVGEDEAMLLSLSEELYPAPQTEQKGLPLGGQPLPLAPHYFHYLFNRIIVEVRDCNAPDEFGFPVEFLKSYTYADMRRRVARALGGNKDPDFLRLYPLDLMLDGPRLEPLRYSTRDTLDAILIGTSYSGPTYVPAERKVLWYETTEYHVSEFEDHEEVRVTWRPDGGASGKRDQYQMSQDPDTETMQEDDEHQAPAWTSTKTFSVLVPFNAKFATVLERVAERLTLPANMCLRLMEVKNSCIVRLISPQEVVQRASTMFSGVSTSDSQSFELRCEPDVPRRPHHEWISVAHLAKEMKPRPKRDSRRLSFFGVPFLLQVDSEGETVASLRQSICERLEAGEDFDQWDLYEISDMTYLLDDPDLVWKPRAGAHIELAIEHKSTASNTHRKTSAFHSKPLKIRA